MSDAVRFTPEQKRALAAVLDEMIPPSADGRLPGAGQLDLETFIENALRPLPGIAAMIAQGADALDALAKRRNPEGIQALAKDERTQVINELAAGADSFPPALVLYLFGAYYQHPRVLEALGLDARPPHPAGHHMEPNDLSLLDPVRKRAKMFRAV